MIMLNDGIILGGDGCTNIYSEWCDGCIVKLVGWNMATGELVATLEEHSNNLLGIVVHPNDPLQFISYGGDGKLVM